MQCPLCRLENPADAQRCECGLDLVTTAHGRLSADAAVPQPAAKAQAPKALLVVVVPVVAGAISGYLGRSMLQTPRIVDAHGSTPMPLAIPLFAMGLWWFLAPGETHIEITAKRALGMFLYFVACFGVMAWAKSAGLN